MNLLRESMTKLAVGIFFIRVWRQEEPDGQIDNSDLWRVVDDPSWRVAMDANCGRLDIDAMAQSLIAMPRVNAVEVLDGSDSGVVYYKDWP